MQFPLASQNMGNHRGLPASVLTQYESLRRLMRVKRTALLPIKMDELLGYVIEFDFKRVTRVVTMHNTQIGN
jgi:hypothetical protein